MIYELLKNTSAYKSVCGDKKAGTLSHAYLICCADKKYLRNYLKYFAKLIMCEEGEPCGSCRTCRLIDKETHQDILVLPLAGEKLKSATADEIVEKTVIKPFELNKRMFVICGFEDFEKNQNKLLKTLEEPPENVILLLGTSNASALLPTVKSRVRKLDIPLFSFETLFNVTKGKYSDETRLKRAIALSGGMLGEIEDNYNNNDIQSVNDTALKLLLMLGTSREVAYWSNELINVDLKILISVLKLILGEVERFKNGGITRLLTENDVKALSERFPDGAICEIIDKLNKLEFNQHFNANRTMTMDRMLFTILEAKHKWQKL